MFGEKKDIFSFMFGWGFVLQLLIMRKYERGVINSPVFKVTSQIHV